MVAFERIMQYSKRLINIGVHHEMTSLNAIRQKYINVFNYLLLFLGLGVAVLDFYNGNILKLSFGIISFMIYSYSIYLSIKGEMESSILITCTFLNLLLFTSCLTQFVGPIEIIPQILYAITATLFLLPSNQKRIIYILVCSILLTMIVINYNFELNKSIPTLIQVIICIFVQNSFMQFVEAQDRRLNKNVLELKDSNLDIVRLNNSLTTKNEEMVAYSNVMTHDLKTPLRNISSFAGLIKKTGEIKKEKTLGFLTTIEDAAASMNTLINNLLNYAKAGNDSVKIEKVDLGNIVNEVISNFIYDIDHGNVKIDFDELPIIQGSEQLLKILFQNLISNSIKYQPKNKPEHIPSLKLTAKSDNEYHYVILKDNGIGIKKEYMEELFEPFRRFHSNSEYEGTGLGMSICRKVLLRHQGNIDVLETSSNGTTFQLSFSKSL